MKIHQCVIMLKRTKRGYLPLNLLAFQFCEFANGDAFNRTRTINEFQKDKLLALGFDIEVSE